jgi:hypothetical protein
MIDNFVPDFGPESLTLQPVTADDEKLPSQ